MFTGDCSSGCRLSIDEGNTIGRQVKQLSATDPDNSACQLKFSITSSDRSYLSIHQTSGMITTKSAIDRETKEVYELLVVVEDCASPPLTDSVTVFVTANDINDNAPQFSVSKYIANVNENQGSGTSVTKTQATGGLILLGFSAWCRVAIDLIYDLMHQLINGLVGGLVHSLIICPRLNTRIFELPC